MAVLRSQHIKADGGCQAPPAAQAPGQSPGSFHTSHPWPLPYTSPPHPTLHREALLPSLSTALQSPIESRWVAWPHSLWVLFLLVLPFLGRLVFFPLLSWICSAGHVQSGPFRMPLAARSFYSQNLLFAHT